MRISDWSQTCALPISGPPDDGCGSRDAGFLGERSPLRNRLEEDSPRRTVADFAPTDSGRGKTAEPVPYRGHSRQGPRQGRHSVFPPGDLPPSIRRSEEHTSELQSLMRISYAVF